MLNRIVRLIAAGAVTTVLLGCETNLTPEEAQERDDRRYCRIKADAMIPDESPPPLSGESLTTAEKLDRLSRSLGELGNTLDRQFLVERCMKELGY